MGYRLALRQLEHKKIVSTGESVSISMLWENVGVAPPYRDYMLALRLANGEKKYTIVSDASIKGWLPGEIKIEKAFKLPAELKPGKYEVALGIVDPVTKEPVIRLAVEGRNEDGWYPISQVEVK